MGGKEAAEGARGAQVRRLRREDSNLVSAAHGVGCVESGLGMCLREALLGGATSVFADVERASDGCWAVERDGRAAARVDHAAMTCA